MPAPARSFSIQTDMSPSGAAPQFLRSAWWGPNAPESRPLKCFTAGASTLTTTVTRAIGWQPTGEHQ